VAHEEAANKLSPQEKLEMESLVFAVKRSIRYHNHRRLFFDRFDKLVKIFSLITGSGAFVTAVGSHQGLTVIFAAIVAVLSAISLVVGPAQAARLHEELARRFAQLECDIKRAGQLNSDQLNAFVADRLAIESDEPPVLRVLDTICHNELCRALGYESCEFYKVDPVQRFFANIMDLWPWRMKKLSMSANC
jgi:hypothetical protein